MKQKFYIFGMLLLFFGNVYAQEQVAVQGCVSEGKVLLRWAPTNKTAWTLGKQYGYVVERTVLIRNGEVVDENAVRLTDSPILHWDTNRWENLAEQNELAWMQAELFLGDSVEFSEQNSSSFRAYERMDLEEKRFGLSLFLADLSVDVARVSGWYLEDETVATGEKYIYSVYIAHPEANKKETAGTLMLGLSDEKALPLIDTLQAEQYQDQLVLSWDITALKYHYNQYEVQRSEDGAPFVTLNQNPVLKLNPKSGSINTYIFTDSIPNLGKRYRYRVAGKTIFEQTSAWSPIVEVKTHAQSVAAPILDPPVLQPSGSRVDLTWTIEEKEEQQLLGFEVWREDENSLEKISSLLSKEQRKFTDQEPKTSNYYYITALFDGDITTRSLTEFVGLIDSIPPAVPEGLESNVDSTGILTLKWKADKVGDVQYYRVYRSYNAQQEFVLLTTDGIAEATFRDSLQLDKLQAKAFYKVTAVDAFYNTSDFSVTHEVVLPDLIPPVVTIWKSVSEGEKGIDLNWIPSTSSDLNVQEVYRKEADGEWQLLEEFDPRVNSWTDKSAQGKLSYKIAAVDVSGNRTFSVARKITANREKQTAYLKRITAYPDTEQNVIALGWKIEEQPEAIQVYRSEGTGTPRLLKKLPGNTENYQDQQVKVGVRYTYYFCVVLAGNKKTKLSKGYEVVF